MADGPAEVLLAAVVASESGKGANLSGNATVLQNPYQTISFYLGFYYDDVGKPSDALRVLDLGLKLSPWPEMMIGTHVPNLLNERGVALNALKRYPEAIEDYDQALALKDSPATERARYFRGRGLALTEMGRLDDAEAAYREAITLVPDDARSQNELKYIAGLRAGLPPAPVEIYTPPPNP